MPRPSSILLLAFVACGAPPPGTLTAVISADSALAAPITTEDGWSLTFTHVVVAVSGLTVTGGGVNGLPGALATPKLVDLLKNASIDLAMNASAEPRSYDTISLAVSRGTSDENVNVDSAVLARLGNRAMYVEGTATKQSTTRAFQLGVPMGVAFSGCMPSVSVASQGSARVDFRVHAQRLFHDDAGKVRFEAWALADADPQDGTVFNHEAARVMTASLPAGHYSSTSGSLETVLVKRSLQLIGLGDSGTCTGQ